MEWEEARAEFFQETYPSDRSVCDSIGGLTATTSSRRTVVESGTADSRRSRTNAPLVASLTKLNNHDPNNTYGSRRSSSLMASRVTRLPTANSTTTVEVASSSTPEEVEENDSDVVPIVPKSPAPVCTKNRTSSRGTRLRMRAAVQGLEENDSDADLEIVDFADENLQTEFEVWKEMKKLKHLSVPLGQKKSMRQQHQKRPKIKLKRIVAAKFASRKFFHQCAKILSGVSKSFQKFIQPIVAVDKHRGSEMFATLSLHRLAILLSFFFSLNFVLLFFVPFYLFICSQEEETCWKWRTDNKTTVIQVDSTNYVEAVLENLNFIEEVKSNAAEIHESSSTGSDRPALLSHIQLPFFYGFFYPAQNIAGSAKNKMPYNSFDETSSISYDYPYDDQQENGSQNSQQDVIQDIYQRHLPLIYICVISVSVVGLAIYFFRQFIGLVKGIVYDYTTDAWFKNVFSSWNFYVMCKTSSLLKHKSIYNHVKQKIRMSKSVRETFSLKFAAAAARCLCAGFTVAFWTLVALAVYFCIYCRPENVVKFFEDRDVFMSNAMRDFVAKMILFLPAIVVTLVKLIILPLAAFFERWEHYPFTTKVAIYSGRIFFARIFALMTLVTTFYQEAQIKRTNNLCWEDKFCIQLVVLAVFDFFADILLTFLIRLPRVAIQSIYHSSWNCTTKLTFDPYESMIDTVCDLALLSVGVFYCPLIPIVIFVKLCLTYPLKLFHVWFNCSASRDIHSANGIRFLFVGFSSVAIALALVSLAGAIFYLPTSKHCGAFVRYERVVEIFETEFGAIPAITEISEAKTTSYILFCGILILTFVLYVSQLKKKSVEKNANDLRCQLAITTQEKVYLLAKIKKVKSQNKNATKGK